jgi:hypothetical protein
MEITIEFQPHRAQQQVMNACDDPFTRFITLVTSRQFGKSKLIQVQALKWALSKPKQHIFIVSPTDSQVGKIFDEMIDPLINSGIVKSKSESSGEMYIKFTNNSIIEFKSARSEDNLRGNTLDYLILDEAAFVKEATFRKILLPMLITRPNSKVLLASTPCGKNWLYTEFNRKSDIHKSFRFTYRDNPLVDMELIETYKQSMTSLQFSQEFEAEFLDSSVLFTNVRECEISEREVTPSTKFYGGVDLAMKVDYSVFSVMNEHGELVFQDRFTGLEIDGLIERLTDTFRKYNFEKVVVETNSFGMVVLQMLREKWGSEFLMGFNTTNKSKSDIISNLIKVFSLKQIKFVTNPNLIEELLDFGYTINNIGGVSYAAISGHDDAVMSLALALHCFNRRHAISGVPIQF